MLRCHVAESCRVVQTAVISKSGSGFKAGIWAIEAKPRLGFTTDNAHADFGVRRH
jgi:hypothetical protein